MNIRDLIYISEVAKHKSFARAADAAFVSQPTLSAQIKKLENELNIQIFERDNKHVLITKAGEQIINQANSILEGVADLKKLATSLNSNNKTTITLGAIPTLGPYLFPKIIPNLKKNFKQIQFKLHEAQTDELLTDLRAGKIDIALLALPFKSEGLIVKKLFKESFELALSKSHPLNHKNSISLSDIKDETILLLNEGHCLRDQTIDVCHLNQTQSFHATSLETLIYMTELNEGVTLLPELACKKHHNIKVKAFKNPKPYREIIGAYRKSSSLSIQLNAILKSAVFQCIVI